MATMHLIRTTPLHPSPPIAGSLVPPERARDVQRVADHHIDAGLREHDPDVGRLDPEGQGHLHHHIIRAIWRQFGAGRVWTPLRGESYRREWRAIAPQDPRMAALPSTIDAPCPRVESGAHL